MATGSQTNDRYAQLPDMLRRAVVAHEGGDLESAYPLYRQFVKDHPEHPTALQLFGLLLSQRGALKPAIALMRESLRLFPEQAEVANNLGNALARSGKLDEAIESYQQALEIMPQYVDALRNLGLSQAALGRLGDAAESYRRALELRPADAPTWLALGNVYQTQNDLDSAVTCFNKALEVKPDYADAHHNLGLCLRLLHRADEALEHYEAAQKLGLDRAELHHNIGNALVDTQKRTSAIDAYRAALERDPLNLETHRNLNALLWQQERLEDYLNSYRRALARNPDAQALRIAYATSLNQQGEHDAAAQVLEEGMYRASGTSEMKSQLAYTREMQNRWRDALALHESAVNTPGSTPNHRVSYARALLAAGRPDEALVQAQAGAALTPLNQRALAYLGLCWRLLGDERDQVLNDYEQLVRAYELPVPSGFSNTAEFNARLREVLDPLHVALRHPAEQTLRGGSQTSGNLFDERDAEIALLVDSLRECIADYISAFPINHEHPLFSRRGEQFDFSASWSVRLGRCGYHTMHTHPLGWISSAYYVQVPDEIVGTDEHGGGLKFGEPDIDIGEAGEARRLIQPATGRLVLFPSYMWHGTVPFESDDPRMTVAFDVVPR